MFDVFWWCSAMARMDTRDSRAVLRERFPVDGGTSVRTAVIPPEETTTFNLVRRLAWWQKRKDGDWSAVLHSRALEGRGRGQRPVSGADLELAVEVFPFVWVDLVLQAKRIYNDGKYRGWKESQVQQLRSWAAANNRTPGMLLYNAEVAPFGGPQTKVTLGACCQSSTRCHGRRWPDWDQPNDRSPLAITLVILPDHGMELPKQLRGNCLSASAVNSYACPLECIFCPARVRGLARLTATGDPLSAASLIPSRDNIPDWAAELLYPQSRESRQSVDVSDSLGANYSLVLPFAAEVYQQREPDE